MSERLKQIPDKFLEWWKKFNIKQHVLMISSVAVVVIALAILGVVLSTPKMVILKECDNTKEASQVKALLDENNIKSEISSDGLVFSVRKEDEATATLLLGENNITSYGMEWDNLANVFDGGFSVTEADKNKRLQLYKEQQMEEMLKSVAMVENAQVTLNIPPDTGTLISRNEESYAWIVLDLNAEMPESVAQGLGRAVATALGNDTTDNITILDSVGNTLFAGGETANGIGTASSNLEIKNNAEIQLANQVRDVIMETNLYNSVSVAPSLDIDFTETQETNREVYTSDSLDAPLLSQERNYEATAEGGYPIQAPGTDANDGITYVTPDGNYGNSTVTDQERVYDNSERTTVSRTTVGKYNAENSSITVVASTYRVYNEAEMRRTGQLDGMTFDEFKAANEERTRLDVDPDLVTAVANATGIPEERISLVAYEVPMFSYASDGGRTFLDYLPIILAALIMLMLGYVVFRSTRKERVEELEPELSVEALLESTREAQEDLEDIGFSEKSEIRILIEKFVDDNPEAVASLLRNWLNEEWE